MGIKYSVNEGFFRKWTPEMAYVLGYLYADGSLEDASYLRGKYVRVSSVERSTIERIRKWLDAEHPIISLKPSVPTRKTRYLLRIGSHTLFDSLIRLGLYPNKSLTIELPEVPRKFFPHFVRGYFDGDGCVRIDMSRGKTGKMIIRKLCTVFTSGSKKFLKQLAEELNRIAGTNQRKIYDSRGSYMLSMFTGDSVRMFSFMYGKSDESTRLQRKFAVYREYFSKRPQRVDKNVQSVLQCYGKSTGNGRVVK